MNRLRRFHKNWLDPRIQNPFSRFKKFYFRVGNRFLSFYLKIHFDQKKFFDNASNKNGRILFRIDNWISIC